jgi:hypothetical protein
VGWFNSTVVVVVIVVVVVVVEVLVVVVVVIVVVAVAVAVIIIIIIIHFKINKIIYNILTITPPATIYSFHPSLISTTLGTYLSRIMIDSLMMAFLKCRNT